MDISVIIPTLKSPSEIEAVEYLERGTFDDYEVVVSDAYPVTRARNEGIERANADKLVFLDDDSRPRENYLEQASKTLEDHYAVAGRIFHPRDDIFRKYFTAHYSHGDYPKTVDRFWGCNMALRREAIEAVGGWDEQMGWGHEEKELAERVNREFDIYYDPEMVVDHPYAESIPDYWRKRYELAQQTPYYWETQGISTSKQVEQTVESLLNPLNYLGRTPTATVTRAGGTIAQGVGRIQGLLANRSRDTSTARPAERREPVGGKR